MPFWCCYSRQPSFSKVVVRHITCHSHVATLVSFHLQRWRPPHKMSFWSYNIYSSTRIFKGNGPPHKVSFWYSNTRQPSPSKVMVRHRDTSFSPHWFKFSINRNMIFNQGFVKQWLQSRIQDSFWGKLIFFHFQYVFPNCESTEGMVSLNYKISFNTH